MHFIHPSLNGKHQKKLKYPFSEGQRENKKETGKIKQGENKKNETPTPVSGLICTFNDYNSCA